jgi:hypothetical protein
MDTGEVELRGSLQDFEAILVAARQEKYAGVPGWMENKVHPLAQWDLVAFFDEYLRAGVYPVKRLQRLVFHLMDVKLQLYYLLEVDLGLYNSLVYGRGYTAGQPRAKPHVFLTRLSLDQSLILKSRILWERIMHLLYHLETGEELEEKVTGRRSKRKEFFERMLGSDRWQFLEPYRLMLDRYEAAYRNPESHKRSVLRAKLMTGVSVDANELLRLVNSATNALWDNMVSIVGGGQATHRFWQAGDPTPGKRG